MLISGQFFYVVNSILRHLICKDSLQTDFTLTGNKISLCASLVRLKSSPKSNLTQTSSMSIQTSDTENVISVRPELKLSL